MLRSAYSAGVRHALVSNLGHINLAKEVGMHLHGDFRLNVFNRHSARVLTGLGFETLMASPELTLPMLRDIGAAAIVYGRIPLMTLEKCVIRDLYSCSECKKHSFLPLIDRKGVRFPLTRTYDHRNIMYNSVPVYMQDRQEELVKYRINGAHYIFPDEAKSFAENILTNKPMPEIKNGIRRIAK